MGVEGFFFMIWDVLWDGMRGMVVHSVAFRGLEKVWMAF